MKDDDIIRKMQAGDQYALEKLMDKYIPYVSSVAWSILRGYMSREDAEEIVSDVFLAAWKQSRDLRSDCVKAWLGAVARNKAKNALRSANRDLPLEEDMLELPDERTPVAITEQAEERKCVQQAVDQLGEPDREVFIRHYYYFQSVADIARNMDMNESTVKTKLRRGRMRLQKLLIRWDVK